MPRQKTERELLDEALAQQSAGTYVDPVADAKRFLSKRTVVDDANDFAKSEAAARRAAETLTPMGTARRYGAPLKDAAAMAAIPASFLGGPPGIVAGTILALEGLGRAVKDPSVGNVGMAALGAVPFVKPARAAMRQAGTIRRIRQTEGAGDMGAAFSRERPYRAGTGTSGNESPTMASLRQESQVPINWRKPPSAYDELMNTDLPQASVVDDAPVGQSMPSMGEVDDVLASLGARLDEIPTRATARTTPEEAFTNFESGSIPAHLATLDRSHDAAMARMGAGRPTDFVHPADETGEAFGFESLPEISEGELSRLQALFKRLGL